MSDLQSKLFFSINVTSMHPDIFESASDPQMWPIGWSKCFGTDPPRQRVWCYVESCDRIGFGLNGWRPAKCARDMAGRFPMIPCGTCGTPLMEANHGEMNSEMG